MNSETGPAPAILIVDDDAEFAGLLADYLGTEGFNVITAGDGPSGLAAAAEQAPSLMILDVMLPGQNGIDVLRALRAQSALPVLMLTARGDDVDRIVGLELGADDYLPKPCNPREVVARIRAILRRSQDIAPASELESGPLRLNTASRRAWYAAAELALTSTEFAILEALMRRAGTPVSKDELSRAALNRPLGRYDRSIDMHISHLRKKFQETGADDDPVHTIRGVGYQLVTG